MTYPSRIVTNQDGTKFSIEYQKSWTDTVGVDWPYFWRYKKIIKTDWKSINEGNDPFAISCYQLSYRFQGTYELVYKKRLIFNTKEAAIEWLNNWNKKFEIPKEDVWIEVK